MQDHFLFFFQNQKSHLAFLPYLMKVLSLKTGVQSQFLPNLESERDPLLCRSPLRISAVRRAERHFQTNWAISKRLRWSNQPRRSRDQTSCLEISQIDRVSWKGHSHLTSLLEVEEHTLVPALVISHPWEGGLWCWSILQVIDSLVNNPHSYYCKQPQSVVGSARWGLAIAALCLFFSSLSNF